MNVTIAVAIITALATIAGGSAAAIITLITQNHQNELQQEARHRQTRRDAYVDLLAKFDEAIIVIDEIWQQSPPPNKSVDVGRMVFNPINYAKQFTTAINIAYLEGPRDVNLAATGLANVFSNELDKVVECARKNAGESGKLIDYIEKNELTKSRRAIDNAKIRFINEAGKALQTAAKSQTMLDNIP